MSIEETWKTLGWLTKADHARRVIYPDQSDLVTSKGMVDKGLPEIPSRMVVEDILVFTEQPGTIQLRVTYNNGDIKHFTYFMMPLTIDW